MVGRAVLMRYHVLASDDGGTIATRGPVATGRVIVATWHPHETSVTTPESPYCSRPTG